MKLVNVLNTSVNQCPKFNRKKCSYNIRQKTYYIHKKVEQRLTV